MLSRVNTPSTGFAATTKGGWDSYRWVALHRAPRDSEAACRYPEERFDDTKEGSPFGTLRARFCRMATAYPLDHGELASTGSKDSHRVDVLRQYAERLAREDPELLRVLGMSAEQYAASILEPGRTVEECVQSGLMSAAECRYMQGCATREDLTELGYSASEVECILEEQANACASCG